MSASLTQPTTASMRELTVRGLIIGALITVVFTAANVYLGLKVGLTFASSIPAAVISMAALRVLGRGTILENNMVQTQASAAGHPLVGDLRAAGPDHGRALAQVSVLGKAPGSVRRAACSACFSPFRCAAPWW